MTTKEKLVLIIDRYEGDIRSSQRYIQMLKDNLPEGYELVLMSDREIKGLEFDQVWIDECNNALNSLPVDGQTRLPEYRPPRVNNNKYWQKGRW